ncbi:unnamed protein product, partial [Musa acuminata var. zebrina]
CSCDSFLRLNPQTNRYMFSTIIYIYIYIYIWARRNLSLLGRAQAQLNRDRTPLNSTTNR